jgi:hypothetical protein
MAQLISDKEFLSKNLYQVMARGMQYEALDAKKTGVKALANLQSNLTQQPSFAEVCHNNILLLFLLHKVVLMVVSHLGNRIYCGIF